MHIPAESKYVKWYVYHTIFNSFSSLMVIRFLLSSNPIPTSWFPLNFSLHEIKGMTKLKQQENLSRWRFGQLQKITK